MDWQPRPFGPGIEQCAGKQLFITRAEADKVARKLATRNRMGHARKISGMKAYQCQICRNWHLTGSKK